MINSGGANDPIVPKKADKGDKGKKKWRVILLRNIIKEFDKYE